MTLLWLEMASEEDELLNYKNYLKNHSLVDTNCEKIRSRTHDPMSCPIPALEVIEA